MGKHNVTKLCVCSCWYTDSLAFFGCFQPGQRTKENAVKNLRYRDPTVASLDFYRFTYHIWWKHETFGRINETPTFFNAIFIMIACCLGQEICELCINVICLNIRVSHQLFLHRIRGSTARRWFSLAFFLLHFSSLLQLAFDKICECEVRTNMKQQKLKSSWWGRKKV